MLPTELPPFVKRGTFTWTRLGYHFAEPIDPELLNPHALDSKNDWYVVAAILQRAKGGDNSFIAQLAKWFTVRSPHVIDRVCILLTGDSGTRRDLEGLTGVMQSAPDDVCAYACVAAASAGNLWLIPSMLDAWQRVSDVNNHEIIGHAISNLLEKGAGPIAQQSGSFSLKPQAIAGSTSAVMHRLYEKFSQVDDDGAFRRLVEAKYREVLQTVESDHISVWQGEAFEIGKFAEEFAALAASDGAVTSLAGTLIEWRRKFETVTGVNCSSFFRDDRFQPLEAKVILEEFLRTGTAAHYQKGRRYFFGHLVAGS